MNEPVHKGRILHVVSNASAYGTDSTHPTGLWLSELVHPYLVFEAAGYEQIVMSPKGGTVPLEPRSLKFPAYDRDVKTWHNDPARMKLLEHSTAAAQIDPHNFDAIFYTGGHAVMFDFPNNEVLHHITRSIYESGGVVAAVCHGYCGLVEVELSNGKPLVSGRSITGFSWMEEKLAGVAKLVPYNAQQRAEEQGAHYSKSRIPFASYTQVDGRIVTGQNPGSAAATAHKTLEVLARQQAM
ncbi:type 1 glutamine amidotransferase domain-containing protein [Corynebacterium sp. 35RC1]|nr:type 1 glutamine amidotransferase domain-containing protein [Corynebacterium sp. 35RC1]